MKALPSLAKALAWLAAVSAAMFAFESGGLANPYWLQVFELACITAISALGLNVIYGFTGLFSLGHAAFYGVGACTRRPGREVDESLDRVFSRFPRLAERAAQLAGTLSGGEQQMLAIGRAMMANPSMMLLDEPSMGLSPLLVEEIFHMITEVNRAGATILLVEQNASMAFSVSRRAYVLETGSIVMQGATDELRNDPGVQSAYLGDL